MTNGNSKILLEYTEQVINAHRIDRIYDYCDEQCVFHTPPYVGLGYRTEEKPPKKLVIAQVAVNGPGHGLLQVGDEVVRIRDKHSTAETFEQLRDGFLSRGLVGETVTITVRRAGELLDIDLVRGRIESFDLTMKDLIESWAKFFKEEMPDFRTEINVVFEAGDKVAYYETFSGTSSEYHASTISASCSIARFEKGKMVEVWSVSDDLSYYLQMGYQLIPPEKEPV
jgi:hypothetical protein